MIFNFILILLLYVLCLIVLTGCFLTQCSIEWLINLIIFGFSSGGGVDLCPYLCCSWCSLPDFHYWFAPYWTILDGVLHLHLFLAWLVLWCLSVSFTLPDGWELTCLPTMWTFTDPTRSMADFLFSQSGFHLTDPSRMKPFISHSGDQLLDLFWVVYGPGREVYSLPLFH